MSKKIIDKSGQKLYSELSRWTKRRRLRTQCLDIMDGLQQGFHDGDRVDLFYEGRGRVSDEGGDTDERGLVDVLAEGDPVSRCDQRGRVEGHNEGDQPTDTFNNETSGFFHDGSPVNEFAEEGHANTLDLDEEWAYEDFKEGDRGNSGPEDRFYSDSDSGDDQGTDLATDIARWYADNNITRNALTELLKVLNKHFPEKNLPISAKTLIKLDQSYHVRHIAGGQFCYIGVQSGVESQLDDLLLENGSDTITLQVNIDGLPLFKSSGTQMWPILGLVNESRNRSPFMIGLFCGDSKPKDLNEFLKDFVDEINKLEVDGLSISSRHFNVRLSCLVCDAPARAYLKCIKSHAGYSGCERCIQHGVRVNNRMTFPQSDCPLRTNVQFDELQDTEHHHDEPSPLSKLNLGLVSGFVLDYMHLVCLGVVRRLINFWVKGPKPTKLGCSMITAISDHLRSLQQYMPAELARKPRSLVDVDRWKATEFRQFLVYYGPLVLKKKLAAKLYENFVCLSAAMTMLLSPSLAVQYCDYAQKLLVFFVAKYAELYGAEYLIYNVHALVHLADDVRVFGALDNISAFPFENYLGSVKKLVRKPQHIITQVTRRLSEKAFSVAASKISKKSGIHREHFDGPVTEDVKFCHQYKEVHLSNFCIKLNEKDNCVIVKNNVCLVRNIVQDDITTYIVYERFQNKDAFYCYPPLTSDLVGMFKVSALAKKLEVCNVQMIEHKCMLLPRKNDWVAVKLLHT